MVGSHEDRPMFPNHEMAEPPCSYPPSTGLAKRTSLSLHLQAKAGKTPDKSPVHCNIYSDKQPFTPMGNWEWPITITLSLHVFWTVGRNLGIWGEPTPARGEHVNSTKKHPGPESNPRPSCCEVTVLTTAPLCCATIKWFLFYCNFFFNHYFLWKPEIYSNYLCKQPCFELWGSGRGCYWCSQDIGTEQMGEVRVDPYCHPQKIFS